jgi:hypothetical protein
MAAAKKRAARKAAPKKAARKTAVSGERGRLAKRIADALGISRQEAELRALRELAERVAPEKPAHPDPSHAQAEWAQALAVKVRAQAEKVHAQAARLHPHGPLPERLYLLLDGRGLDGRGLPVEVIDVPTVIGSERHCTVWVNSPQIETRHAQIVPEDGGWYLEDLGSEKGTYLGDERISRRRIQHGDEYRLAGYLRLRTEFR